MPHSLEHLLLGLTGPCHPHQHPSLYRHRAPEEGQGPQLQRAGAPPSSPTTRAPCKPSLLASGHLPAYLVSASRPPRTPCRPRTLDAWALREPHLHLSHPWKEACP